MVELGSRDSLMKFHAEIAGLLREAIRRESSVKMKKTTWPVRKLISCTQSQGGTKKAENGRVPVNRRIPQLPIVRIRKAFQWELTSRELDVMRVNRVQLQLTNWIWRHQLVTRRLQNSLKIIF